jgi:uridine kinase
MINPILLLIIGASGAGKTTVIKALSNILERDRVEIIHFDDIGVPSFEKMVKDYGGPEKWQQSATHEWMKRILEIKDKEIIILEGSFNPEYAYEILKEQKLLQFRIICLDVNQHIREQRLLYDRMQPELVFEEMENFAQFLKRKSLELGGIVIDTSNSSIKDLAKQISEKIC